MPRRSNRSLGQDIQDAPSYDRHVSFQDKSSISDSGERSKRRVCFYPDVDDTSFNSSTGDQKKYPTMQSYTYYSSLMPSARSPLKRTPYGGQMSTHQSTFPQDKSPSSLLCRGSQHGQTTGRQKQLSSGVMEIQAGSQNNVSGPSLSTKKLGPLFSISHSKKGCCVLLIFLVGLICFWFVPPEERSKIYSFIPGTSFIQGMKDIMPGIGFSKILSLMHLESSTDDTTSAPFDTSTEKALAEVQQQLEDVVSKLEGMQKRVLQEMETKVDVANTDNRLHLGHEAISKISDYKTKNEAAVDNLILIIKSLEAEHTKLLFKLNFIKEETGSDPTINLDFPEPQQPRFHCGCPLADRMPNFAQAALGATVMLNRTSETHCVQNAGIRLFGFHFWCRYESPDTVIEDKSVLIARKCWAFPGDKGTLAILLSHPVRLTHVTLDHLHQSNSPNGLIDSAPKDFEIYGMENPSDEGTLLGTFTFDRNGESTQTFKLPSPSDTIYRLVELRVLSNWGQDSYTCLYRFRVHGRMGL